MGEPERRRSCIEAGLGLLGVKSFVLNIQDPSFPADPEEDTGRGSPYSDAGLRLVRFFRDQGFTGIQFGPQGLTPAHSSSPYEGTLFSRDPLSISLSRLAAQGMIANETLAAAVRKRPAGGAERVPYGYVYRAHRAALSEACGSFGTDAGGGSHRAGLPGQLRSFAAANEAWLPQDALYDLLRTKYGQADWKQWYGPEAAIDRHLFAPEADREGRARARRVQLERVGAARLQSYIALQYHAHRQHRAFKKQVNGMGMKIYGDLQIGFSDGDVWSRRSLFLPRYLLGAPPSRTNPEGQPWGYPVLNPDLYRQGNEPGPAAALLALRMEKMFREYDAIRIDHPHGLVCPWVYRSGTGDSLRAVRNGARLFSTPDAPDHPDLARFAIPRPDQLNATPHIPRHYDDWVRDLDPRQVERYAALFDVIVAAARQTGRELSDLVPEVLSTLPYPLRRVLKRYGLGRFRVTQKANLARADDVYRSENAAAEDWVMAGNHDTKPVWTVIEEWRRQGVLKERAGYLAARLAPAGGATDTLRSRLTRDPGLIAQAQFADLFAAPAAHVMVFFTDFFGMTHSYNRPGTVSEDNWSLRLPVEYHRIHRERLRRNRAFNVPLALALALGTLSGTAAAELRRRLLAFAGVRDPCGR